MKTKTMLVTVKGEAIVRRFNMECRRCGLDPEEVLTKLIKRWTDNYRKGLNSCK